jgi:hypothetical protein
MSAPNELGDLENGNPKPARAGFWTTVRGKCDEVFGELVLM